MNVTTPITSLLLQPSVASLTLVRQSGHASSDVAWEQITRRLKVCVTFDTAETSRQAEVPVRRVALSEPPAVKHHHELRLTREAAEPVSMRGWGINE